jgi:hypothetical protein
MELGVSDTSDNRGYFCASRLLLTPEAGGLGGFGDGSGGNPTSDSAKGEAGAAGVDVFCGHVLKKKSEV